MPVESNLKILFNITLLCFNFITFLSCNVINYHQWEVIITGDPFPVTVERGGIRTDGASDATIKSYESWIRSAFYIKTNGATSFAISVDPNTEWYLWQYDSAKCVISSEKIKGVADLSRDCEYVRFQIKSNDTPQNIQTYFLDADYPPSETKNVQVREVGERLIYAIDDSKYTTAILLLPPNYCDQGRAVPLIVWDSGDGSFSNWDYHEIGDGYPGRINGINYLRDNGFAILEIYSWGSYYYNKYPDCGRRSAMPIPTHLKTHEKGVEYVISRYNIDKDNIFHVSKSGSGKLALYYAMFSPSFNLKSIYAFAPVFDDLNFVGWGMKGYRYALYEELDFQGTEAEVDDFLEGRPYEYDVVYSEANNLEMELSSSWQMHETLGRSFIEKNAEKFQYISVDWMNVTGQTVLEKIESTHEFSRIFWEGYNRRFNVDSQAFYFSWDNYNLPASHTNSYTRHDLVRKGNHIPFTVIMSPTDGQTPYWNVLEVIRQFENSGKNVKLITLESGGHSAPDLSVEGPNVVNNITTRLGVNYENVSYGWYYVVDDIYDNYLK